MHLSFLLLLFLPFLISGSPIDGARSLRSFHGTFLRARNAPRDSVRVDLAQNRFGCERWYVEDVPLEGKVTIKSHCTPGGYLKANTDGSVGVVDTKTTEAKWTPSPNPDGTWALKSSFGWWLSGRLDGNVKTIERCDSWEYFWIESFP